MEHHHHHQQHHHLHGHSSRYAPLPPQQPPTAPVFLAPDPYRRHPHLSFPPQPSLPVALPPPHSAVPHHHRPDNGGVVYVSYAPTSSHASDNHGSRLLPPPNLPERLVVKAPQPLVPSVVRVSDRIIFPDGHPEAPRVHHHPRRPGGVGEAFVREDLKRERVRVLDDGQGALPYGRREGEAVELAAQEDAARRLGLLGRKRARWEEGRSLGEDPSFDGFLQGRDPDKRLSSGPGPSRRRSDVVYDLRAVDAEASRGSACVFAPERGEAMIAFSRPPLEMPLRSPSAYSVSKLELFGKSQMTESETLSLGSSHGLRERNSTGRGKRYVFGGEEEVYGPPKKVPQQKRSVLTRIQFSKPVYKRKCEQQISSVASPLPLSPTLAFSENNQFERDVPVQLDVSFKSDVLVAKEIFASPVSASSRSIGEACSARTTKKDVIKVTRVSPGRSFSRSDSKVTSMHAYKLKIREERFAPSNAGGEPNRERTPKNRMANKILASSNSVVQKFDDVVTTSRTPRNKVASEVSTSPNHVRNSINRVSRARLTEKKMAENIVALQDIGVQGHGGKATSTRSPKMKQTKELVIPQGNGTSNSNDIPSLKTLKKLSCDATITTEQCPKEGLSRQNLVNSADTEPDTGGKVNSTGSTGMMLENETFVAQKVVLLNDNENVTSVNDPKKEVLDNTSFPSASVVPDAEKKTIIDRPKEKPGKNAFTSPSSVVNSDKKIINTRLLKKKIIKKSKKKKLVASVAPCFPSVVPTGEIIDEHVPTNICLKSIEPSEKIQLESTMTDSHIEQQYLKGESRDMKHSETVEKVSDIGSSCTDLKDMEGVDAKFVSWYPKGMPSKVRILNKKEIKGKNTAEFTLDSCALESGRMGEICERPLLNSYSESQMHSKDTQSGSPSHCFQTDPNRSEETHKDGLRGEEVHKERLDAGEAHNRYILELYHDVGQLDSVHDTSEKIMDLDFLGKCQEQQILPSCHDDAAQQALLQKEEIFDVDKLDVDDSSLNLHRQGVMLQGHLGACPVVPSYAMVPIEFDTDESPNKSFIENATGNRKSSIQQEDFREGCNVNLEEDSGCDKHLFAPEETFLPGTVNGKQVQNEGITLFDEESSLKAKISSGNGDEGQKLPLSPQLSAPEELEMVCCEKDAATVLHCPIRWRSVLLQVEAQTAIPELEKERKLKQSSVQGFTEIENKLEVDSVQKQSPVQDVNVMENKLGEIDSISNIIGRKRSRELHLDALGLLLKSQDAASNSNLLIETDGQEGSVSHLPCTDVFSQASTSITRVDSSVVNSMAGLGADGLHSPLLNVSSKNTHEHLASGDQEKPITSDLLDSKSCCPGGSIVEKLCGDSTIKSDSKDLSLAEHNLCSKSDLITQSDCLNLGKTVPQQPQEAEKQADSHQLTGKERLACTHVCQRPGTSTTYPNLKSPSMRTFEKPPSRSLRHNKWYRTENPSVSSLPRPMKWPSRSCSQKQSPKKLGKTQSSYIRKGNSLIRKSSAAITSSHPHPEETALDQIHLPETNKNVSVEDKIVGTNCLSFSGAKILSNSFERPKTPPLPLSTKPTHPSLSSPQTLIEDPLSETGGEGNSIPSVGTQGFVLTEENHSIPIREESKVSGKKKMIYVKHRSNQLIAAPSIDANNSSVHTTEESPALSFAPPDIYYRNKNKLIRDTSLLDGQLKKEISLPNDCSDAKCHGPPEMSFLKGGAKVHCKARLGQGGISTGIGKTYKQSRFSLVWTLGGLRSQDDKCSNALKHQMALPLFPWKRATYWRGFITKRGSNLTKHSMSSISRKLQLSRQRGTIYTVSKSGFSLRKSGVLSVGGSHLKWSKSMERHSRKASKEATLAIVEREKKKKKQKQAVASDFTMKSENCSQRKLDLGIQLRQGERIFRVGTIHYKMDPSRRTLLRIPDEQTPTVTNNQSVHGAKMSIVPRRLLIGDDEYIRVGNGNQLVRDPKKLVRILANEKIRWSLHTARLRSVRKQQYCQFFTRFGKCNKEDGKCPYIHDPTKIAICTKFLKGLCSSPNCKLTHKVIPERMPDCSYFLQGLCTNVSCPYRHVNVNPKASVCEGFLKGYCRDGDECRKKHSYVCPHFEASGECPHRSTCKLHHPKRANKQVNKSRKRKRTPIQDHGRGRYFGSGVAEVGESQAFTSNEGSQEKDEDIFFHDGQFAEYIDLDVDTDDDGKPNDLLGSHPILMDSDLSDSQSSDADALIKPIQIMNVDVR